MKNTSKIERVSLRIFWICMVLCAVTLLTVIWSNVEKEVIMKTIFTFFVIGLANFLVWFPIAVYRLIDAFKKK